MSAMCGCCRCLAGAGAHDPIENRPGLSTLRYRTATHATFLDAMIAKLSSSELASLRSLTTRETDDPAIAFLDAWAVVGDVLTFYQERLANEAFLRTATGRRSLIELARLVGYVPKPGVSASTFLAYTLDAGATATIPAGAKAQSASAEGGPPPVFETKEALEARGEWNLLAPLAGVPQAITNESAETIETLWISGTDKHFEGGELLLFVFAEDVHVLRRIARATPETETGRTALTLIPAKVIGPQKNVETTEFTTLLASLAAPPAVPPVTKYEAMASLENQLSSSSDTNARLVRAFVPAVKNSLYTAIANEITAVTQPLASVHVLRKRASVFGYNVPDSVFQAPIGTTAGISSSSLGLDETADAVFLDTADETIAVGSYTVIDQPVLITSGGEFPQLSVGPNRKTTVARVVSPQTRPRNAWGTAGKTTRLKLDREWWTIPLQDRADLLLTIRNTAVFTNSEELTLALMPLTRTVGSDANDVTNDTATRIELDVLLAGFDPGRWVVVSGERADILGTSGVVATEAALVTNVEIVEARNAGESRHSVLVLAREGLAYEYKREGLKIYGNVVKADHGEQRTEILGRGDASKSLQSFTLRNAPLTFVAAATQSGVASTLTTHVNGVRWQEVASLAGALPSDRVYVTKIDDEGKATITFGTGREGARLPTGENNVRATYRSGLGEAGNAAADTLTTALTRPPGLRDVTNPLEATGGADAESIEGIRRNAPVAIQALGRVVSIQDHADFARTFAGIAKASAAAMTDGRRRIVHLTIGGDNDIEIATTSDLYTALLASLAKYGDPYQPLVVTAREKIVVVGSANVKVHPDYLWSSVAPQIRATLLETFAYERRDLGQTLYPSEVIAAIQNVAGVDSVDLDALGGVQLEDLLAEDRAEILQRLTPASPVVARLARSDDDGVHAAQIAYMPQEAADLFVLTEVPNA